jgi:Homeodomain-like domain
VSDRNAPQKHVWRAKITLATADGCGTAEIMRRSGKAKPVVWRWQARFMAEGVAGLTRDKTRKPGKPPLPVATVQRVVDLALSPPPGEATHWTGRMLAKAAGVSLRSVQRILEAHQLAPHRIRTFKLSNDPKFAEKLKDIVGLYVDPPRPCRRPLGRRKEPNPGARSHPPARTADEAGPRRYHDARLQTSRHYHAVRRPQRARRHRHRTQHDRSSSASSTPSRRRCRSERPSKPSSTTTQPTNTPKY